MKRRKELADLQNNVNGQLATKASVDDVNKLGTDVTGVKTDLETTKSNLNMARGEFGTLIAKNHDEIDELRRLGERDYYEFTIDKKGEREKVGDVMVELRSVNPKKNIYTVAIYVDDSALREEEPLGERADLLLHQRQPRTDRVHRQSVGKDKIARLPERAEGRTTHAQAAGN